VTYQIMCVFTCINKGFKPSLPMKMTIMTQELKTRRLSFPGYCAIS